MTADWRARRILLIGQAPGPTGPPPGRPLVGGKSGTFLQDLAGCPTLREYIKQFETRNVLDKYPGRSADGKGDRFPIREARAAAEAMTPTLKGRRVIFVGHAVMAVFGHAKWLSAFEWRVERHDPVEDALIEPLYDWAWVPHPSPVNRVWNYPETVEKAKAFFRQVKADWSTA
mgnify:CR=1 FL=1